METTGKIVTRIYIDEDGDIVVTDLWEEIRLKLFKDWDEKDQDI